MNHLCYVCMAPVLATFLCTSSYFAAEAQEPMNSRGTRIPRLVAVIDMQKLLTDFPPFVSRLEELRKLQEESQADIDKQRDEIEKRRRSLDSRLGRGTIEYEAMISENFAEEGKLQARQKTLDFRVDRAETKLYVTYFLLVESEIQTFARAKGIGLVINRSPTRKEAQDADGAQALFGQKVVYEQHIDITNDILDRLEAKVKELPALRWD